MPVLDINRSTRIGTFYDVYAGPQPENGVLFRDYSNRQFSDGGHYGFPDFPPNTDVGGNFGISKFHYQPAQMKGDFYGSGPWNNDHYDGVVLGHISEPGYFDITNSKHLGAEAYAKMKPTKPEFSALNSIYELKDIPGMLKQRFRGLKDIPSYHLALEFGWKPLLSDCRTMILSQKEGQKRLNQLLRDNGKSVRRRMHFLNDENVLSDATYEAWGWIQPGFNTYFWRGTPTFRQKDVAKDEIWASARFRYWLPPGPQDIAYKQSLMRKLYGVQFPSPSQIYNAIPWSWLIDWYSNVGYLIENLDGGVADRLAADYFYMMRRTTRQIQREFSLPLYSGKSHTPVVAQATGSCTRITKSRFRGDPFGFATNHNDLSSTQVAILGALGLSRIL